MRVSLLHNDFFDIMRFILQRNHIFQSGVAAVYTIKNHAATRVSHPPHFSISLQNIVRFCPRPLQPYISSKQSKYCNNFHGGTIFKIVASTTETKYTSCDVTKQTNRVLCNNPTSAWTGFISDLVSTQDTTFRVFTMQAVVENPVSRDAFVIRLPCAPCALSCNRNKQNKLYRITRTGIRDGRVVICIQLVTEPKHFATIVCKRKSSLD